MTIYNLYIMHIIDDYTEITVLNPYGQVLVYGRWNTGEVYTFVHDEITNFKVTVDNHVEVTIKEQFYTIRNLVYNGVTTKDTKVTVLRKDGTILGKGRRGSSFIVPYCNYKINEFFIKGNTLIIEVVEKGLE